MCTPRKKLMIKLDGSQHLNQQDYYRQPLATPAKAAGDLLLE